MISLPRLIERIQQRTVRLAVTGLSGSGKTAFITSVIHNLSSAIGRPARLPFLRAAAERRILAARGRPVGEAGVAQFPIRETIAALAGDPPEWPASTTDLRRADIRLRFAPEGLLGRISGGTAELRLEILDYPGEWLLDLPLLRQGYRDWSHATLDLARRGSRAALARDWLDFSARHSVDSSGDAVTAARAHELYGAFLRSCRSRENLSFLQPGRFLNPGHIPDPSLLHFCPLPFAVGAPVVPGSLASIMETRFEAYKRTIVQPFFALLAGGVDRQIVLVDVLRALNAGEEAFADHRLALETIFGAFRFGRRSLLPLLFGARIDRVLFAATKTDHVPGLQRDHLEALMADLVAVPRLRAEQGRARVAAAALASIRCTEDGTDLIDGRKVDVVIGLPQGGERRIRFFPGIVPMTAPPKGFWGERFTEFPVFQPPRIEPSARDGIPHINLDRGLEFLLGDTLA